MSDGKIFDEQIPSGLVVITRKFRLLTIENGARNH